MKYNRKRIGERIKAARKEVGYSQGELAEKLGLSLDSRQVVGKWEKGEKLPHFELLLKMCEVFGCELGYLLCEYDCKTRVAADVTKVTGLSEDAANRLISINQSPISGAIETLSKLIMHEEFGKLLRAMHLHIFDFNNNRFRMDPQMAREIASYMKCSTTDVTDYMESSSRGLIETSFRQIIMELK